MSMRSREHILFGSRNGLTGGHAPGTGLPFKTEFPVGVSHPKIIALVESVARNPDRPPIGEDITRVRRDGSEWEERRWVCWGKREVEIKDQDGSDIVGEIDIKVVVAENGVIVTGHPLRGTGVMRNDQYGNPHPVE
ncbi:hypothetical protein [Nocardia sp. NPDC019395]|uniref:hypothetical protein n=1 Tax=Nocardia sp. NPDC019395 TaxID=3154686 RepID=UPI0033F109F2